MTIIDQGHVSKSISFFKKNFMKKYKLNEYTNLNKPCIFYGCYNEDDLDKIIKHKSLKVVVFGGTDTYYKKIIDSKRKLIILKNITNIFFISQSKFISDDLKNLNIKYIYLPIAPTVDLKSISVKKGKSIYVYTNPSNELNYGSNFYYRLMKDFKDINFILTCAKKSNNNKIKCYSKNELHKVYASCFLGLRLIQHDGISATIQEMGLLGIKTISNGNSPACINYTNYDSIVEIIKIERKKIGEVDNEISKKTYDFLNINDDWLDTKYYTN
jgi:hypothetical protein